jgi:peptidyl-tRNA hydrolase, PTH1 family
LKYLILGLGNIGAEYQNTRHNIGFAVLDAFAKASGISFSTERHASVASCRIKSKTLVLAKPTTYMNLSGKALLHWMQQEKIPIENTLTIVDDIALPFGRIRIKASGSDAGHNGLKHIIESLGHKNFPRLRFGIGDSYPKGRQIDYVLGQWNKDEQADLPQRIDLCCKAIESFALAGISQAMSEFNKS